MDKIISPFAEGFSDSLKLTETLVAFLAIGLVRALRGPFVAFVRHKKITARHILRK
ncbi:MAG: hypothetical protein ABI644_10170 [Arenimonas sp.]